MMDMQFACGLSPCSRMCRSSVAPTVHTLFKVTSAYPVEANMASHTVCSVRCEAGIVYRMRDL